MQRKRIAPRIVQMLLAGFCVLLISCTEAIEREFLVNDGVVERLAVTGNTQKKSDGPLCAGVPIDSSGKSGGARVGGQPKRAYRVGPGDDLRFNIFGEEGMSDLLARVDAEGYVQLPVVDAQRVTGQTTREIQSRLIEEYSDYFVEPWITVELANAESHPLYFLGEFRAPGVHYMEFATELIEALALAEGLEEDAYLPGARLIRRNHVCTVDLNGLLKNGDFSQNVWMESGDIIFAPLKEDMRVYVLGAVGSPGAITFGADGRTLLEALSVAGGPIEPKARLNEIRIIRSFSATRGELILVDASDMLAGKRLDFALEPGDVIYVPQSVIGSWNQAVGEILPGLQLISGILTPIALIDSL